MKHERIHHSGFGSVRHPSPIYSHGCPELVSGGSPLPVPPLSILHHHHFPNIFPSTFCIQCHVLHIRLLPQAWMGKEAAKEKKEGSCCQFCEKVNEEEKRGQTGFDLNWERRIQFRTKKSADKFTSFCALFGTVSSCHFSARTRKDECATYSTATPQVFYAHTFSFFTATCWLLASSHEEKKEIDRCINWQRREGGGGEAVIAAPSFFLSFILNR